MPKKESKVKEDGAMEDGAKKETGVGDPAMNASAQKMPPPMGEDGDPAVDPQHADQSQDVELFKQLISQYLGDGHGVDEDEAMKMAQTVYGECKEAGMDHDESMKCAGYGLKAAHMMSKKETKESVSQASLAKTDLNTKDPAGSLPGTPGLAAGSIEKNKEGLPPTKGAQSSDKSSDGKDMEESKHIALVAENARLKESIRKIELESHLNKMLEGCGLPMQATKAFRELVKDKKNPADIDSAWKLFKPAFVEAKPSSGFFFGIEKQPSVNIEARSAAGAKVNGFSDCVTDNKKLI